MSNWFKIAIAMFLGGLLSSLVGNAAQQNLIFSIYFADNISREFMLSGEMCFLLGAFTAATFVIWKFKWGSLAARFAQIGASLCLIWLSIDRDSKLYHWWKFRPWNDYSFSYWNEAKSPLHELLVSGLIFNGIPLLWAGVLLWWGFKLSGLINVGTKTSDSASL